jgi:hypothetical protein
MVGLVVVLGLINGLRTFITSGFDIYFAGEDDAREDYLDDRLGWHMEAMRQINALPSNSEVRFLWEPRYLYCDEARIDCRTDSLMDAWYYARRTVGDPGAVADRWRSEGTDYLLVYEFGREFERDDSDLYTGADWTAWETFAREFLIERWRGGENADEIQYILYQWRD